MYHTFSRDDDLQDVLDLVASVYDVQVQVVGAADDPPDDPPDDPDAPYTGGRSKQDRT